MSQPTPNDGARQMGMVNVESAIQMLEQALPTLGSNSPEGAAVLKAMSALSKLFGKPQTQELIPAQLMELVRAQGATPIAQLMGGGGAAAVPPGAQPAPAPMAA